MGGGGGGEEEEEEEEERRVSQSNIFELLSLWPRAEVCVCEDAVWKRRRVHVHTHLQGYTQALKNQD